MTIAERLFAELHDKGLKASSLCKLLGVANTIATNWKQRNTDPPAKYIPQIAEFLGVSEHYLLTGETDKDLADELKDMNERLLLETYRSLSAESKLELLSSAQVLKHNEQPKPEQKRKQA